MLANDRGGLKFINSEYEGLRRSFFALALGIIGFTIVERYYFDFEIEAGIIPNDTILSTYIAANFTGTILEIAGVYVVVGILALRFGFSKHYWRYITSTNWLNLIFVPIYFIAYLGSYIESTAEMTIISLGGLIFSIAILLIMLIAYFQILRFTLSLNKLPAIAIWILALSVSFFFHQLTFGFFGIELPLGI